MRERLPGRRNSWIQKVRIGEPGSQHTYYCSFGEYTDGRLGEIFIDTAKDGSFARGVIGALARMASIALQCQAPIEEVVHSLRDLDFPPNGKVTGEYTQVKECTSVMDWVAQEIELAYIKRYEPVQDESTTQDDVPIVVETPESFQSMPIIWEELTDIQKENLRKLWPQNAEQWTKEELGAHQKYILNLKGEVGKFTKGSGV
jgi:hypothetical protein